MIIIHIIPIVLVGKKYTKLIYYMQWLSILIKHIVGLSVCLSVCLSVRDNLSRLKSERHETRHVGPLGTWKCH